MYCSKVESFTHKKVYDVILSKKFLGPEDHVLLIDDFHANGCALLGLIDIFKKSGATLEGVRRIAEGKQTFSIFMDRRELADQCEEMVNIYLHGEDDPEVNDYEQ